MGSGLGGAGFRAALLLLWLAALTLLLTGLNGPPLLDWDEGIVARVSLELSRQPWPARLWPSYWGDPYLNKPPGLHLLVAAAINAWQALAGAPAAALPPAWLLRLAPALISALLVPLLALLQWRLRPGDRLTALLSGAIALTLLPLQRHGHLLMLDGCQLVAMVLLWWAVLGPPRGAGSSQAADLFSGLLAGLATSALLLLKAPVAVPVLAGSLLLRLLERDMARRRWTRLGLGVAIGLLPGLAWHGGHWLLRGDGALEMWLGQGFARVGAAIEGNSGGPQTPVLEVLEGGWPWLPLWPFGIGLAWRQRRSRAGLWCLGLTVLSAGLVLPLRTQLPWYSLLLWPPFALVCAPVLAWLVRQQRSERPPAAGLVARIPRLWSLIGAVLVLAGLAAALLRTAPGLLGRPDGGSAGAITPLTVLAPSALLLGAGLLVGGLLLSAAGPQRRRQGLALLLVADGLALALLFASPLWLWELHENWPVADGLSLLQAAGAGRDGGEIRLWRLGERPSLSWYAGRHIRPDDHLNPPAGRSVWVLGLESAEAPGLHCQSQGRRGELRLERCWRRDPGGAQGHAAPP